MKALVVETNQLITDSDVIDTAYKVWPTLVKDVGVVPKKYLVMFESIEELVEAQHANRVRWNIFQEMRIWNDMEDISKSLVWLECYGIHPKLWSRENILKIREIWGEVLCFDINIERMESLCHEKF